MHFRNSFRIQRLDSIHANSQGIPVRRASGPPRLRGCVRRVRNGSSWKRGPSRVALRGTRYSGSTRRGQSSYRPPRVGRCWQPSSTVPNSVPASGAHEQLSELEHHNDTQLIECNGTSGCCMRAHDLPAVGRLPTSQACICIVSACFWRCWCSGSVSALTSAGSPEKWTDDEPSCDWTLVPHRGDYRVLSSSNGAPTSWGFDGIRVSRTYHSDTGLGHPCWDQTLRFQSIDENVPYSPVPSAVAGVVISGTTEAVLGGLDEASSDDSPVRWKLTEGRAPDASQGSSSSTSTSSTRVGNSHRWTYWLSCTDGESHAIATVETTAVSVVAWTLRVRLMRTCPGVWSHLAVNIAPPRPRTSIPHPLDMFYDALGVPLGLPPLTGSEY